MRAAHGRKPAVSNRTRQHLEHAADSVAVRTPNMAAAMVVALLAVFVVVVGSSPVPDPRVFRANDTLLGTRVTCTDAEKTCFRYNRLLDAASGKCYRVGSRGPCLDEAFLLDRHEFDTGRRLVGVCGDPGRCPDHRFRMAYDGQCYTGKEVFGMFCDVRKGTSGWPYFFGGYECLCEGHGCPPPRYVAQPAQSGECFFPNFRKDLTTRFFPRLPRGALECSLEHSRCFAQGAVAFGPGGHCFELLERGPCSHGEHLVLDKQQALRHHRVATRCVPEERCPAGSTFITHLQRCVNESKIEKVVCPDLDTFTDVFGETVCRFKEEYYEVELKSPREGMCSIRYNVKLAGVPDLPKPDCDSTDPLDCLQFEDMDPDILMSSLADL